MAGSNGYNFVAGTKARGTEVNSNFEWFRGHYLPVTQSGTWANTTGIYDLGSSSFTWRAIYLANTSTAFNGNSVITPPNVNSVFTGWTIGSVNTNVLASVDMIICARSEVSPGQNLRGQIGATTTAMTTVALVVNAPAAGGDTATTMITFPVARNTYYNITSSAAITSSVVNCMKIGQ